MVSQVDTLLQHFAKGKSVSRLEALHNWNIQNITARIRDIRDMGFRVQVEMKKDERGGEYARYSANETERRLMQSDLDRRQSRKA